MSSRQYTPGSLRLKTLAMALVACMAGAGAHAELPRRSAEPERPSLPAVPEPAGGEVHGKDHEAKKPVEMSPEAQAAEVSRELLDRKSVV